MKKLSLILLLAISSSICFAQKKENKDAPKVTVTDGEKTLNSQWKGKKVAFLGDSMTDKRRVGTTCIYWEYLKELMGIEPFVYGISGRQWDDIDRQAQQLYEEHPDVDAIIIFCGTNDYMHNVPLGEFYSETMKETNFNGNTVTRKFRTVIENDSTLCGRINKAMDYLKSKFPQQQIIIMTPIHRNFAKFNAKNIQPEETFANAQGLYVESYVNTLKQAACNWAVPLIDLYSISGLYPMAKSNEQYFHNSNFDLLHPNANGDYRLAKTIQYQLLGLPAGFVRK